MPKIQINAKPFLTHDSIVWLKKHLTQDMVGIEYGGGGSTPWLAKNLGRLYTVETNFGWAREIVTVMNKANLLNKWAMLFVASNWQVTTAGTRIPTNKGTMIGRATKHQMKRMEMDYIRAFNDVDPDFILIDGSVRRLITPAVCEALSVPSAKKRMLMIDNVEMGYDDLVNIPGAKRIDFPMGPKDKPPKPGKTNWLTTAWVT